MGHEMTKIAEYAIRAAKNFRIWGRWATLRYAEKRGVSKHLLGMAIALEQLRHKRLCK